jgi:hypothetical protein
MSRVVFTTQFTILPIFYNMGYTAPTDNLTQHGELYSVLLGIAEFSGPPGSVHFSAT